MFYSIGITVVWKKRAEHNVEPESTLPCRQFTYHMEGARGITANCIWQPPVVQIQARPEPDSVRRDGTLSITLGELRIEARNRRIRIQDLDGKVIFMGSIEEENLVVNGQASQEYFLVVVRTNAANDRNRDALQSFKVVGGQGVRNAIIQALLPQGAHVRPFDLLEVLDVTIKLGEGDMIGFTFSTARVYSFGGAAVFHVENRDGQTVFMQNVTNLSFTVSVLQPDPRNGGTKFFIATRVQKQDLPVLLPTEDPARLVLVAFQFIGDEHFRAFFIESLQQWGATIRPLEQGR